MSYIHSFSRLERENMKIPAKVHYATQYFTKVSKTLRSFFFSLQCRIQFHFYGVFIIFVASTRAVGI